MQEFLIITIVLVLLFSTVRRFIFFNTADAFKKAADDFYKRQEEEARKRAEEGRVYVDTKKCVKGDDKYDAYEEVKD